MLTLNRTIHSILFVMTTVQFWVMRRKAKRAGSGEKGGAVVPEPEPESVLASPPRVVDRS